MTPDLLGTIGVYLSAIVSTVGFVAFVSLARFWRSRGGWHVFWFMLVITWILDLIVVRLILGDAPWFAWLRAASFALGLPAVLGWRLWIIFDLQLRSRYRNLMAYGGHRQQTDKEEENSAA